MKLYGTPLCHDCVDAFERLKNAGISYDYVEITKSMPKMKEFLHLRDNRDEFIDIKKEGYVGVPCFLLDDDSIGFDTDNIIRHFSQK
ncbi:hypothetical protein HMPREF0379_0161 [[Eubacterium] yurii subsp. margaretiae ATCC 43715]|nr:hypothetical protein HMPREF0379_0161 [[Eubacterium] yurii subsp. margaretiae ATCC 43715]